MFAYKRWGAVSRFCKDCQLSIFIASQAYKKQYFGRNLLRIKNLFFSPKKGNNPFEKIGKTIISNQIMTLFLPILLLLMNIAI